MDIYDYQQNIDKNDVIFTEDEKKEVLAKIMLDAPPTKFNLLALLDARVSYPLSYRIRDFNNRAFDLVANYVMLKKYYNSGIADDPWFISPGKDGNTADYFPEFTDKDKGNHYWFGFYSESFYTRFEGMIDSAYHIYNIMYELKVPEKLGFRRNVSAKLKQTKPDVFAFLKGLNDDPAYKLANKTRNDLVHNYRHNQVTSGYKEELDEEGNTVISFGIGEYTQTKTILESIYASLDLLADLSVRVNQDIRDHQSETS